MNLGGRSITSITKAVVSAVVLSSAVGCGYTTERPFRKDIQSVYVPIFESKEFRRGLEFQLTEALQKRIQLDTPYRIADKEHADTELTGEIIELQQQSLGRDFETGLPREHGATLIVSFRWKDLRSGEILVDRPRFIHTIEYIPPLGEQYFSVRQGATKPLAGSARSMNRMAERIVEEMEDDW